MSEITYKKTGERQRGRVASYHRGMPSLDYSKGAFRKDIACLPKAVQRRILLAEGIEDAETFGSRYTIGFEVEKNEFHRAALIEHILFARLENDGSCGYEAISHILPLIPAGTWRNKVFDLMFQASKIIEEQYSRSNEKRGEHYKCGGHTTIAVNGMSGDELRKAMRPFVGILWACFRNRLSNEYCAYNLRMADVYETNMHVCGVQGFRSGWHHKYQAALVKGNCLEFRLVARFESVRQMMRRYQLFYEIVDFAVTTPNGTHSALLKRVRPIIMSMYDNNQEKVDYIMNLATEMRTFILTGRRSDEVKKFIKD